MRLGALSRHQDLGIHPDGKVPRFDADHRAHPVMPLGPTVTISPDRIKPL
jgi:hypothetical protein